MTRVIVMCGGHKYLGDVDQANLERLQKMERCSLTNAYELIAVAKQMKDPRTGQIGIMRDATLMGIGLTSDALKKFWVRPDGWFDPKKNGCAEVFERLLSIKHGETSKEVPTSSNILLPNMGNPDINKLLKGS